MKDFLDNELNIGDNVVIAVDHGRNSGASLCKAVVTGFTETLVKVYINDLRNNQKKSPKKVFKIP